ncbi:MAG TPA: M3 family oligoendopeptidase [Brevefilum fermentans]|jgi:oligoendopeptidase F|uniref:Putative M3 family peptidase n=1 Tax=Candidatus Brevifilum fermentans TaxID=1986204 RepID=A0A1Y6K3T2_9CHLR|nr:M3 family oligoendopeptidase [Brevefilum fermentans]MDI9565310.1 M3 family oligoendopeptidase [Chloroflexota bacterium]OQB87313.1 MAG: Oligoendopeptidase F, plasmid [Chloroflexi bacterium ADurb.Bin120]SMX53517.1 putative M3 family peptidase [Brevefilum fermentans]HOM67956.1 M3 family oligoendopeptidase [Brevefilum fermentans]HQA29277.1 M3 family oligoendopeptidase [Brevefilum fermentans]
MTQKDTYTQSPWSLEDLFLDFDDPAYEAAFEEVRKGAQRFQTFRDQLVPQISEELFLSIITEYEHYTRILSRLFGFSQLAFAADTQDQAAQAQVARVTQFYAEIDNQTMFFSLWWKALDNENAERLLKASGDFHYWLVAMRNFKAFTLSEAEEKIINIKDVTGVNALNMLYESITNRYLFKVEIDGELKELTRGEVTALVREPDPDLRERAYQALFRVYEDDAPILGQIYQAIVRDWRNENLDLRKFKHPVSVRNLVNDIPDPVVETLLDVTRQNAKHFQRFFRLKAKRLGVEKLRRYDIYAPVEKSDKKYAFDQAAKMVLESFHEFDPKFADLAKEIFDARHVDSEIRKGKMSGAFCATITPDLAPWVLLNYQGKAEDVATMAHELGHGIHALMAREHTAFTQHACLPLAETASTFGEMMLIDKLLVQESDQAVRRDLLFRQMDDAFATILRQNYFSIFEHTAHELVAQGAQVDDLAKAYLENLQDEFGDSVEIADEFRWEWVMIPHIYNVPFYVYAYAFGQLLVLSLYKQYQAEGNAFKPRYMDILAAGGSIAPIELLARAGIDVTRAEFWQGGFDIIDEMVTTLENLT